MKAVTIRNVPEEVYRAIRVRAAQNGRTLQAEMREILTTAVKRCFSDSSHCFQYAAIS